MSSFLLKIRLGQNPCVDKALAPFIVQDDNYVLVSVIGRIIISIEKQSGKIKIKIPFTGPDQLYYKHEEKKLYISNDPRRLFRKDMTLDIRGLYSLFQFASVVPPLSIWQEIKRFIPGRQFEITPFDLEVIEKDDLDKYSIGDSSDNEMTYGLQEEIVAKLVDQILIDACPNRDPIILFSGGVDSALLAARAKAMGWRDTLLVHYTFRKDDKESILAKTIATHLNLQMFQVDEGEYDVSEHLDHIAEIYRHPFGDYSLLSYFGLSRGICEQLQLCKTRIIIDGTGADGAFGYFGKVRELRKLYRLPIMIRHLSGDAYKIIGYWKRPTRYENQLRLMRQTTQMPLMHMLVADNPLSDITYYFPVYIREEVYKLMTRWLDVTLSSEDDRVRGPGIDLAMVCSDIFAQKNKSFFDLNGYNIVYPFLDTRLVDLALQRAVHWPGNEYPKHVLKRILARQVPHEMVYRTKSGFSPNLQQLFANKKFINAFDQLLTKVSQLFPALASV